ncbi:MAG: alanine--glyoxylate aminotransferase family protein [Ignavibacteria bacterium]|nr:alanine--glyoxylate aminotransferase family protein [Ignavibacteria bacterium]
MSQRLFTPGPVPVLPSISEACARPLLYHRSNEFRELSRRVWDRLQQVFLTKDPVVVLSGSGMTGIESCIASTVRPGDRVLVLHHGRFGERLITINQRYGAHVIELGVAWSEEITAEMVEERLSSLSDIASVWLVHSETSTGVSLDLEQISEVVHRLAPDALLMVDSVLTLAIEPLRMTDWKIDAAVAGIQKGLMCPPGAAVVAISQRMIERIRSHAPCTYTLDLATVLKDQERGLFTWTPPVSLIAGLDVALSMILDEGLLNVWKRHAYLADYVRNCAEQLGLMQFGCATSKGVVVVQGDTVQSIIDALADQNMIVAGGQDRLKGRIMRIGTCGSYTTEMMSDLFETINKLR